MALEDDILAITSTVLGRPNQPLGDRLEEALRTLCKWRAALLEQEFLANDPPVVAAGPFAGMRYLSTASEGCLLPKLLGCYEQELHAIIEGLGKRHYDRVINLGCAEGYYAVGLALRDGRTVYAHDISEPAQAQCKHLAALNGVADKVHVGGAMAPEDFTGVSGKTLLLCDIEGAEKEILDPTKTPALAPMDILVEVHESFAPGIGRELERRFEPTHRIEHVIQGNRELQLPQVLHGRASLDQLLALWEGRLADPGWLWMTSD